MSIFKTIFSLSFILLLTVGTGQVAAQNFPPPKDPPKKNTGKVKPSDFGIKSKKAMQAFLKGRQNDTWRDFETAVKYYEEALSIEQEFTMAAYFIAQNSYLLFQMRKDPKWLDKGRVAAIKADEIFNIDKEGTRARLDYYLAEYKFYELDYEGAIPLYERFLAANVRKEKKMEITAQINLKNSKFAKEAIKEPIKYQPKNLGENINSIGDEYLPNLTADESMLFITARRPECMGGYRAEFKGKAEDFFYSEFKKGKWGRIKNLGPPVNTDDNEGAACLPQMECMFTLPPVIDRMDLGVVTFMSRNWKEQPGQNRRTLDR